MCKRIWTVMILAILLAACKTHRTVESELSADSVSVNTGEYLKERVEDKSDESLIRDTRLKIVLSVCGDTLRTDRELVTTRTVTRTLRETVYRDRWRTVNHRTQRTITRTVRIPHELSVWERIEIYGFRILLLILILTIVTLTIKSKIRK